MLLSTCFLKQSKVSQALYTPNKRKIGFNMSESTVIAVLIIREGLAGSTAANALAPQLRRVEVLYSGDHRNAEARYMDMVLTWNHEIQSYS
jgi:hypothetical protein